MANGIVGNDSLMRQNSGTASALATKMYEESLKMPVQRDSLDDAALKVHVRSYCWRNMIFCFSCL